MSSERKFKNEFREISALGRGGFSTVFEAKCIDDGKSYAIKKIPIKSEEIDKAMKEIKILGTLDSDFVVNYIDSWIEDNYYIGSFDIDNRENISSGNLIYSQYKPLLLHIQMELCSMGLNVLIKQMNHKKKKNTITIKNYSKACDIFSQLLECVQYLHQQNPPIIHRDLKPENIMLITTNNHHKVKLTDFGLSTYHEFVDQSHTKYIGTKAYRAPEVNFREYDTKADIYSLGIIMQELFNIDYNSDFTDEDFESQSKYENAKRICEDCVSTKARKRPECQLILNDKHLWFYKFNQHSSRSENIVNILTEKWPKVKKIKSDLLYNCKKFAIIDEIEEKAIFDTKNGEIYALSISDRIDSTIQEPKVINELLNQKIQSIECGKSHVLCLTKDMRVYSFGDNSCGQLGNGEIINNNKLSIVKELKDMRITDIKCGAYHSAALSEKGKIFVWGSGLYGQIGNGINSTQTTPIQLTALNSETIISISCGYKHCLALSKSGILYGWGENECGQLGIGNNKDQNKPEIIKFDEKITIKTFCCGQSSSLVLTNENNIYAFGSNFKGKLGIGNTINQNKPIKVQTTIKFIDIKTTFIDEFSIGLSSDNHYYIWGECNNEPIISPKLTKFNSFHETNIHYSNNYKLLNYTVFNSEYSEDSLVVTLNAFLNELKEWNGFKYFNQKMIANIMSLSVVRIKESKAVFVTNDDNVYTLRLNDSIDSSVEEPVIVNEMSNKQIKRIHCGYNHALFLTENNEVYSFGDNFSGQLGNGSRIDNYKPTVIKELSDKQIIEISCGGYHYLALSESGKIFVWGGGRYGQIGNGFNNNQLNPFELKSLNATKINAISCGAYHCLSLSSNGALYVWGDNDFGQLGIGNNSSENKPILIGYENQIVIKKISCGKDHSLLLTYDYIIYSFGRNNFGQLGIGSTKHQNRMIKIDCIIKFIDIDSNWCDSYSAGLSQTGKYYIWGKCGDDVITAPKQTEFTSFDEIIAKYSTQRFFAKNLQISEY